MKGFTLIELIAVIVLLGIISLIIIPIADKSVKESKQKAYDTQIENIKSGAKDWTVKNTDKLPKPNQETEVSLQTLIAGGYVEPNIQNPLTEKPFVDLSVVIKNSNGNYIYEIKSE